MTIPDLDGRHDLRLALQAISWGMPSPDPDTIAPFLDGAVSAGYEGVGLFALQLQPFIHDSSRLRDMLDQRGLQLAAVTGFVNDTEEWAEQTMSLMAELGVQHLACTDFDTTLTMQGAADILNHRGKISEQYGVSVYYHNHTGGIGETMTEVEELMGLLDPDEVHVMLDIGHATKDFAELPPDRRAIEFLTRHWDRIEYLELKDWNETTDLNTPVGEGHANYDAIFGLIESGGYSGWLTVEQNHLEDSLGRDALECATISRSYLARYGL